MDSTSFLKKAKELGWIIYPYPSRKKFEEYLKEEYMAILERLSNKTAYLLFIFSSNYKFFSRKEDYIQEASIELFKEYEKDFEQQLETFAFYKKRNDRILIFDWAVEKGLAISHDFKKKELTYHYFDYFLNFKKYLTGACRNAINRYNRTLFLEDRNTVPFKDLDKKNLERSDSGYDENTENQSFMDYVYNTNYFGNKQTIFGSYCKIDRVEDFTIKIILIENLFKKLEQKDKKILLLKGIMNWEVTEISKYLKISRKTIYKRLTAIKEKHSEELRQAFEENKDIIPYFNRPCSKTRFKEYCRYCDKRLKDEPLMDPYFKNEKYDKKKYCSLECSDLHKKEIALLKGKIKQGGNKFTSWLREDGTVEGNFGDIDKPYNDIETDNIKYFEENYQTDSEIDIETKTETDSATETETDKIKYLEEGLHFPEKEYLYIGRDKSNQKPIRSSKEITKKCKFCEAPSGKNYCGDTCKELYNRVISEMTEQDWQRIMAKDKSIIR